MERFVAECDLMSKRKEEAGMEWGVVVLEVLLDNGCTVLQGFGGWR